MEPVAYRKLPPKTYMTVPVHFRSNLCLPRPTMQFIWMDKSVERKHGAICGVWGHDKDAAKNPTTSPFSRSRLECTRLRVSYRVSNGLRHTPVHEIVIVIPKLNDIITDNSFLFIPSARCLPSGVHCAISERASEDRYGLRSADRRDGENARWLLESEVFGFCDHLQQALY